MRAAIGLLALLLMALAGCADLPARPPRAAPIGKVDLHVDMIRVAEWGGTPADETRARLHTIRHITLHHGGTTFTRDKDVPQHLRNLQAWSRRDKNWIDIPYHYVIDLDGKVYEGRDIRFAGDTNTEYDPAGHALIVVLGNYEEIEPTEAQLNATAILMAMLARQYGLGVDAIASHRDHSKQTVCPGKHLYRYLEDGSLKRSVSALL